MPVRLGASSSSLIDRIAQLLQRVDYRRADSPGEREAIFRLRYEAYLREGEIGPVPSKRFTDHVDDEPNTFNFGVYLDGVLAGAIRLSVTMTGGTRTGHRSVRGCPLTGNPSGQDVRRSQQIRGRSRKLEAISRITLHHFAACVGRDGVFQSGSDARCDTGRTPTVL